MKLSCYFRINLKCLLLITVLIGSESDIFALEKKSVSGKLIDQKSNEAVAYANVALYNASDSMLVTGTISDDKGRFSISPVSDGRYRLLISALGYQTLAKEVEIKNGDNYDLEVMFLKENAITLNEAVVVADRPKAKAELDKTTYFITQKMVDASNTGTDILRLVTGVQIDLMQNISLEGSRNILILVDGKERDRNFVNQIIPKQIDKVEIISSPPSKYDANITGVINIVMKKEHDSGISGQIFAEIPTSSTVYVFPTYSFTYVTKRMKLFTSYNGEITHFDNIVENSYRKFAGSSGTNEIKSSQYVRQNTWSHRFHYGFDYFFDQRNQLNFYAFCNPLSREYDGQAEAQMTGSTNHQWNAQKEDTDINVSTLYSLYFKHIFNEKGSEIIFDISNYHMKADNTTTFIPIELNNGAETIINSVKPRQNAASFKIDYNSSAVKKLSFSAGIKAKFQLLQDANSNNFKYSENMFAAYSSLGFKQAKYDLSLGLRIENSVSDLQNKFGNTSLSLLPHAALNVKLSSNQNIQLSWNRSLNRPGIYQLDPYTTFDDPFTVRKGNPFLNPEIRNAVFIEHSIRFKTNFISTRLFYNKTTDAINDLTFINDTAAFEHRFYNLGIIHQYGVQWTGALKVCKIIAINPYLKLFGMITTGNNIARHYSVPDRHQIGFESSLSTILSFNHDLALSLIFQYNSPKNNIQGTIFSDALYFLSIEKTYKKKFKVGIVSAIPFTKAFTYQGYEAAGLNFYSHYQADIKMSAIPVWFRFSYQFNSGRKKESINHSREEIDNLQKKGF